MALTEKKESSCLINWSRILFQCCKLKLSCELKLLQKAIVVYQEFILNSPVALYGSCLTGSICWLSLVVGNIF